MASTVLIGPSITAELQKLKLHKKLKQGDIESNIWL